MTVKAVGAVQPTALVHLAGWEIPLFEEGAGAAPPLPAGRFTGFRCSGSATAPENGPSTGKAAGRVPGRLL